MNDLRQTESYARYMLRLGWVVDRYKIEGVENLVFIKRLPFVGSIAKIQRPPKMPTPEALNHLKRKYGLVAAYLEPQERMGATDGFVKSSSSFVPAKTIQINLELDEQALLSRMKPKTRYNIGLSVRRGVVVENTNDINLFLENYTVSARERGLWISQSREIRALFEEFKGSTELLFAYKDENLLAGLLVIYTPQTAYYMYAWTNKQGRHFFAPTLLTWEAIRRAKSKRKKIFDFEGVYDERYHGQTAAWKGFTRFKEGFGGRLVEHPPTKVRSWGLLGRLFS